MPVSLCPVGGKYFPFPDVSSHLHVITYVQVGEIHTKSKRLQD